MLLIGGIPINSNAQYVIKGDSVCVDTAYFIKETRDIQKLKFQREYLKERLIVAELRNEEVEEELKQQLRHTRRILFYQRSKGVIIGVGAFLVGRLSSNLF